MRKKAINVIILQIIIVFGIMGNSFAANTTSVYNPNQGKKNTTSSNTTGGNSTTDSAKESKDSSSSSSSGARRQTIDQMMQSADKFISGANTKGTLNDDYLDKNINDIYNILLACGMIVAVACGVYLGIKFITDSSTGKAEVKESLVPYVVGCVIIFGAFGIWKIVMLLMERFG